MGLDGDRSIGMPKSSSERSSKLEFSDSEFVFGGVKFNRGIDMGEGGRERDGDLGEMVILGWRGGSRGWWIGGSGGWGSLPIFPSKESCGREWRGNWYWRGTGTLWRGGSGSLPILPSKESSGREWMGNRYCRGTRTF